MDDRYLKACSEATVACGLDVVSAALSHAGVPHVIEQTGGFTMVLYVDARDRRLGVAEGSGVNDWSVYRYNPHVCDESRSNGRCDCSKGDDDGYEGYTGESLSDCATLDQVVAFACDFFANHS